MVTEHFRVAIHYSEENNDDNGYIDYDPATKKITVSLNKPENRRLVEEYLAQPQVIWQQQHNLLDLRPTKTVAAEDVEQLKLVLGKMWEATGVMVDWSRPIGWEK